MGSSHRTTGMSDQHMAPAENLDFDHLRLITVDQLCDLFRIKKSWVYDAVEDGRLPAIRLGKQLRFREAELISFLAAATTVSDQAEGEAA